MKPAGGGIHPIWDQDIGSKDFEVNPDDFGTVGISNIRESQKEEQHKGAP